MRLIDADELKKQIIFEFGYRMEYGILEMIDSQQVVNFIEPMTNKDWLNSMSAEVFADWLTDTFDLCGAGCSNCFVKEMCFDEHNNKMPNDLIVEWLKQPHTQVPKKQEKRK